MNENNIVVKTECGSRIFDLFTTESDYDFRVFYIGDSQNISTHNAFTNIKEDGNDIFCYPLQIITEPAVCASIYEVSLYSAESVGDNRLIQFYIDNQKELANISPIATYQSAITDIEEKIEKYFDRTSSICIRNMSVLWMYYYTGDMSSSRIIPNYWRDLYFNAKNKELSKSEVQNMLMKFKSRSIKSFFMNQSTNYDLFYQYKKIIDIILEGAVCT